MKKGCEDRHSLAAGRVRFLRAVTAGVVMGGSLLLLVMGFWPQGNRSRLLFFPAETLPPGQVETLPLLHTARTLTLEWPPVIRMEDSGRIHLSFEPASPAGPTPVTGSGDQGFSLPSVEDNPADPTLVEARLEMAGAEVDPPGIVRTPMSLDQGLTFTWTVRPPDAGSYRGVVWLYLRSVPSAGGIASERALAALPIDIQAVSVLGLGAGPVRILGVMGLLVGLILDLSFLRRVPRGLPRRVFERHDENNIK